MAVSERTRATSAMILYVLIAVGLGLDYAQHALITLQEPLATAIPDLPLYQELAHHYAILAVWPAPHFHTLAAPHASQDIIYTKWFAIAVALLEQFQIYPQSPATKILHFLSYSTFFNFQACLLGILRHLNLPMPLIEAGNLEKMTLFQQFIRSLIFLRFRPGFTSPKMLILRWFSI
ncbi:unnamed protein product [Blepharisma stoltei]|uniref:Uncharacterized protein n=1 Tax=Blepharisma stoltei TaxID=1481888 RepID=A0AAU9J601_9CILI|nr:unnamed protein product [Blepharisma stoltei]